MVANLVLLAASCGSPERSQAPSSVASVTTGVPATVAWTLDRSAAVAYADAWSNANGPNGSDVTSDGEMANPAYVHFDEDDCANFVSQSWLAGGVSADAQWWANATQASTAWQNVNDFVTFWLQRPGPAGVPAATLSDSIAVTDNLPVGVSEADVYAFHFNTQAEYWNHVGLDVYANASGSSAVETTYSDSSGFTVDYGGQQVRHLDQHTIDRYRSPWNYGWLRNINDPTMTSDEAIQAKQGNWVVKALRPTAASPPNTTPPVHSTASRTSAAAAPTQQVQPVVDRASAPVALLFTDADDVKSAAIATLAQNDRLLLLPVAATSSEADRSNAVDARAERLVGEVAAVWSRHRRQSKIDSLKDVLRRRRDDPNLYPVDDIRSDISVLDVQIDGDQAHVMVRDTVTVHVPDHDRHPNAVVHQAVGSAGWSQPSPRRYELVLVKEEAAWRLDSVRNRSV